MKSVKIALFGKMRSGKNTVADLLKEKADFKEYSFGSGIGEIIKKYYPTAFEGGKPRQHYQHIGQSLRELDADVWINYTLSQIEKETRLADRLGVPSFIVITDGRQVNEARRLREDGYLIVKVECDEAERLNRIGEASDAFDVSQLNHETELQVDYINADYTIKNNGTLEELEQQVTILITLAYLSQMFEGDLSQVLAFGGGSSE